MQRPIWREYNNNIETNALLKQTEIANKVKKVSEKPKQKYKQNQKQLIETQPTR